MVKRRENTSRASSDHSHKESGQPSSNQALTVQSHPMRSRHSAERPAPGRLSSKNNLTGRQSPLSFLAPSAGQPESKNNKHRTDQSPLDPSRPILQPLVQSLVRRRQPLESSKMDKTDRESRWARDWCCPLTFQIDARQDAHLFPRSNSHIVRLQLVRDAAANHLAALRRRHLEFD